MTQKMKVTFDEDADQEKVMAKVLKVAKKVEPDFDLLEIEAEPIGRGNS